ncbi:MAG: hypothetical protein AB8V53_00350 [Arsenophonus endosymbiont of Dermacentor nuttalli]
MIKKKLIYTTTIMILAIAFSQTTFAQSEQMKIANVQQKAASESVMNKTIKR